MLAMYEADEATETVGESFDGFGVVVPVSILSELSEEAAEAANL
jgi:hypothetical protein